MRLFPSPSPELYAVDTGPASLSAIIAKESAAGGSSYWQKILALHEKAFRTECEGRLNQADFYWSNLAKKLDSLAKDSPQRPLAYRFAKEIVIDTHLAFARGYEIANEPIAKIRKERKSYHIKFGWQHALWLSAELYPEFTETFARYLIHSKAVDTGVPHSSVLEEMEQRSNEPEFWIDQQFKSLQAEIDQTFTRAGTNHASELDKSIKRLDKFAQRHPLFFPSYPVLGQLHYLDTLRLVKNYQLSDALLALRKARAYWPETMNFDKDWEVLSQKMREKQQQINEVIKGLPYNGQLNADGLNWKRDADKGFSLANHFKNNQEPQIAEQRQLAVQEHRKSPATTSAPLPTDLSWAATALPPAPKANRSGEPPFSEWLWSGRHLGTKLLAVAAAISLMLVLSFSIEHRRDLRQRNAAYEALTTTLSQANPNLAKLAPHIEYYFSHSPRFGSDARDEEVAATFEVAFSTWFYQAESYQEQDFETYASLYQLIQNN